MRNFLNIFLLFFVAITFLVDCSSSPRYTASPGTSPGTRTKGAVALSSVGTVEYGVSSYYADDFHGKLTANGEVYDMYGITAAHNTLPLNTIIRVTNLENKKSIIVRINDRGPFIKNRILDCSYGAAIKLGFIRKGTARVKIEVIELGNNQYWKKKD
jgi:rare lipoprotein A